MGYLDYAGFQYLWGKLKEKFAPKSHTHDDRYYTETELNTKLNSKAESIVLASNANLNNITTPGLYSCGGGNTITNKPSGVDAIGLIVTHNATGAYYTQILTTSSNSNTYRRTCLSGTWSAWTQDKYTDTNTWRGIQNNLTSDSTSDSLSAAQGKALKTLVDGKLPLNGGTLTGNLHIKGTAANKPLQVRSIVGSESDGITLGELHLQYQANSAIKLGNDAAYSISADGGTYTGKASKAGTADVANSVDWSKVQNKPSTFTPSAHNQSWTTITDKPALMESGDYSAETIEALLKKVQGISPRMGSCNLTKDTHVANTWWNFIYTPHRTGVGGDNGNYGTLLLFPMVGNGSTYIIRAGKNAIVSDIRKIYTSGDKPSKSDVGLGNVDNTADANKSVKYATSAGSATKATNADNATTATKSKSLQLLSSTRPTDMNFNLAGSDYLGKITYQLASSTATNGKPPADAGVLNFSWDNGGWGAQVAVSNNNNPRLYTRGAKGSNNTSTWDTAWKTVAYTDDGSVIINNLTTGTATPKDDDYYVSQYAGGGTTNTTYHRRTMSALWNYIKSKAEAVFAPKTHTHTKSQITDFPTSLKNPSSLTIIANGTTLATYDGSAAKTASITKASIGLGNVDNTADSAKTVAKANRLTTARTVSGGSDITLNFTYDGSSNTTANIGFYSCKATLGNTNNYPFHRFAKLDTQTGSYVDKTMTVYITQDYNGGGFGICRLSLRTNNSSSNSGVEAKWLIRQGISADFVQVAIYNVYGKTYADAFLKINGTYCSTTVRAIASGARGGTSRTWTLIDSNETNGTTADNKGNSSECWKTIAEAGTDLHNQAYSATASAIDSGTVSSAASCSGNAATATVASKIGTATVGSATRPVYINAGVPTAGTYTLGAACAKNVKSLSAVGTAGWTNQSAGDALVPTMAFMAFWNGAHSGTSSNLQYCDRGRFGTIVTKGTGDYATAGHTHKSVIDNGNGSSATTFAYSKSGMNYADYTWLAAWNGYELRAVNKSQFATAGHNHNIESLTNFSSRVYDATVSRTANTILAAPNGSNGVATFRKLVAADLPAAYLPLTGGTMTGRIIRNGSSSWINDRNQVAVFGNASSKDAYNPVVGQKTPNGAWTIGNLASNEKLIFNYSSDTNFNAGKNETTQVYLPAESGTIITSATIGSQTVATAGKLGTSAGSVTQPVYFKDGKPAVCTYSLNKTVPSDAKFTDTNTWRGIQNNLTSTSTTDSLSAAQGKWLNDNKSSTTHSHGLNSVSLAMTVSNATTDAWSMVGGNGNNEFVLRSLRMQANAPSWLENNYAAGIVFGGSDTRGVISHAYRSPAVKFAGGNGSKPTWYFKLTGTSGNSYNLDLLSGISSWGTTIGGGGGFIRFVNGIQICWGHNDYNGTATGGTLTFQEPFIYNPQIMVTPYGSKVDYGITVTARTTSNFTWGKNGAKITGLNYIAIGNWKT